MSECMVNNTGSVYTDLKKLNPNDTDFMWAVVTAENNFDVSLLNHGRDFH